MKDLKDNWLENLVLVDLTEEDFKDKWEQEKELGRVYQKPLNIRPYTILLC